MAFIRWKEIADIAYLQFESNQWPDFKRKASEFFEKLDNDADGKVWLSELLAGNMVFSSMGTDFLKNAFYGLDRDCKGHLDFKACVALYFVCVYSTRKCGACKTHIIPGSGYTCLKCHSLNLPSFHLCFSCFSSSKFRHEHGLDRILHDYTLLDRQLLLTLSPSHTPASSSNNEPPVPYRVVEQTLKQCVVCGDFHEPKVKGFMGAFHMSKMRNTTTDEFVCEWCFSYFCAHCGARIRDSTLRAEPGKWLQRYMCAPCHWKRSHSDSHDTIIQQFKVELQHSELLAQCKTCEIKHRRGILMPSTSPAKPTSPLAQHAHNAVRPPQPFRPPMSPTRFSLDRNQSRNSNQFQSEEEEDHEHRQVWPR